MNGRTIRHNLGPHHPQESWPSVAFKVPRPSWRSLRIDQRVGCPLAVVNPRRYWRVRWAGLGYRVGAWPHVEFDVENRSGEVVHSFQLRLVSGLPGRSSGAGIQPEEGLPLAGRLSQAIQDDGGVAVVVDFVQFCDGGTWYSAVDGAFVTEAGVRAGTRAAATYLLHALKRHDSATIIAALPRLHADVPGNIFDPAHADSGFYCGVTNLAVRLQHACEKDDPTKDLHSWLKAEVA
jgi:hypothetical protein